MEVPNERSSQNCQSVYQLLITLTLVLLTSSGCSVYMAAKQPGEKDLSVLRPGSHRGLVIAEFGAPVWSGDKNGEKTDIFVFKQGYSAGARTARALFHGTADVFSLGLWEVVSTPTEAYFSGSDTKLEIVYDSNDLVKSSRDLLSGNVEPASKPVPVESTVHPAQTSQVVEPNSAGARTQTTVP